MPRLLPLEKEKPYPNPRPTPGASPAMFWPMTGKIAEEGFSEEEWKMIRETRKILGAPDLLVCPTTVRVPVRTGTANRSTSNLKKPISVEQAKDLLRKAPGIIPFR